MGNGYTYLLCLLYVHLHTSNAEYMTPSGRKPSQPNACDSASKTSLVEHFFNVIFSEFHNSPPVCICVQMCADQPTYCYPNGCLRKVDSKKNTDETRPAPEANIQNVDASNTMFLIENDISRLLNENNESSKNVPTERASVKGMRPDPFKDRYKMLFKFKKMPKVELRYNLREQVKNMKSDIIRVETQDISKKRWPNGIQMFLNEKQKLKSTENNNERQMTDTENTKFFINTPDTYPSKSFKRDLRKFKGDNGVDADYPAEKPDLDNQVFSIETLIDNLIGNNYGGKRDTDANLYRHANNTGNVVNNNEMINSTDTDLNHNKSKVNSELTCIVSINKTNQNLDKNKYTDDNPLIEERLDKWKNYTFNEMISALSKKIEKQNNTSMEMMKQVSRNDIKMSIEKLAKPLINSNREDIETLENLKTAENTTLHKKFSAETPQTVINKTKISLENSTQESK